MSIDTGFLWSANSLQRPVHQHLQTAEAKARQATSRPLPDKGPHARIAQQHRLAVLQQVLGGQQQPAARSGVLNAQPIIAPTTPVVKPAVAPDATSDLSTKVMSGVFGNGGPGNPVAKNPYEIKTPGVNPAIATAVPQAPSTGIPTMAATSGWIAPGANFQIR